MTCPECGLSRPADLSRYNDYFGGKSLTIRCKRCSSSFAVTFDYRRYRRLTVRFPGEVWLTATPSTAPRVRLPVVITSLSVAGVGFVVQGRPPFVVDETLDICFRLDDPERSMIQERITMKYVRGDVVGAAYTDDTYRYELDFYVMHP